jgi:hypothetical protein
MSLVRELDYGIGRLSSVRPDHDVGFGSGLAGADQVRRTGGAVHVESWQPNYCGSESTTHFHLGPDGIVVVVCCGLQTDFIYLNLGLDAEQVLNSG